MNIGNDDQWLIDRARRGEKAALDELVRRHSDRLYRIAHRLTRDQDQAGDLVADTFVRVYKGIKTFKGESAVSTWLYRILMNSYLDARKRASNRPTVSLQDEGLFGTEMSRMEFADTKPAPDASALTDLQRTRLRSAISSLPEGQRKMIQMYHGESLSYEEIAAMENMPIGTVKSRLNRARTMLRELLEDERELFLMA